MKSGGEKWDRLLGEMEQYAEDNHIPILRSLERDKFLEIVGAFRPHRILEIGTAIGYSALLTMSIAAEDARLVTIEINDDDVKRAREFFARSPYNDRIELFEGNAGEVLPQLWGPFDFVFIDAAKGQYPDYWRKIQHLLTPNALVIADNVLFQGMVEGPDFVPHRFRTLVYRLREFIKTVKYAPGYHTELYHIGDGMTVSWRNAENNEN